MIHSQKKILLSSIFLLFVLLCLPKLSSAISEIGISDGDVEVNTIPNNPVPNQNLTINLKSFATDLNKANIVWQNGSKVVLSGIGKTSYTLRLPGANTATNISITITPAGETDSITKTLYLNPSEVELLWEGVDSYTPPFYRGKSFISSGGLVKVVAIPATTKQGRANATYTWKNNDSSVQRASGYNKDSYVFANNELNLNENVSVTASSVDGSYNATNEVDIPIVNPTVIFYKRSPTEGILYNRALLDDTYMSDDEMTVVAEPYYLAIKGNESAFSYKWQINDEDTDTPSRKKELTIRPAARGGYATLGVVFENLDTFFQKVSGKLKLTL